METRQPPASPLGATADGDTPMPYRRPSHPPAGTYYASCRVEPPHLIFSEPRDYEDLKGFLVGALKRSRAKLLGYCWMPDALYLALTVSVTPVSEVMLKVTQYCSWQIHRRTNLKARYTVSFPVMLPRLETHLSILLRYIHYIPVIAGAADGPDDYPYSSYRAYGGEPGNPMVTTALPMIL